MKKNYNYLEILSVCRKIIEFLNKYTIIQIQLQNPKKIAENNIIKKYSNSFIDCCISYLIN